MTISPTGTPAMIVKNGFQRYTPYNNPKYDSYQDEGFKKLGTIIWKPIVETDENGTFAFSIPNFYQKDVRVVIEGIGPDGTMISESHLVNIP